MKPIQAMLLAAGRGQRMRPLTDNCPKPLLAVRGKPLVQWSMEALARGGFTRLVVNTAWLGDRISGHFGKHLNTLVEPAESGAAPRNCLTRIEYSHEGRDFGGALETAGGIVRALPKLGEVFWVLAGDIWAPEFVFSSTAVQRFAASGKLAHLWLVPNPTHNPKGDFGLAPAAAVPPGGMFLATNRGEVRYTFSTIALYRRALFAPPYCNIPAGNPEGIKTPLAPLLRAAMDDARVSAELYTGEWTDVGTPQRLAQLNNLPTSHP